MIIGTYPCCGETLFNPIAEKCPAWEREECPHCGKTVWHYHSRINPHSYIDEDFREKYEINEDTKEIEEKDKL